MNILVCGDSHSLVFEYSNDKQNTFNFHLCYVGGATAQGLVNPNSNTNALPIFAKKISENNLFDKILIVLGEVDCGFVIWVRSKRYNISIDEQIETCIHNLFNFIENVIIHKGYEKSNIILAGAVLPTIKDNTDKKYLYGARSEVDVSQYDRTQKTLEYNLKLQNKCKIYGYKYIEITPTILGENGIVKDYYLTNRRSL